MQSTFNSIRVNFDWIYWVALTASSGYTFYLSRIGLSIPIWHGCEGEN